MPKERKRFSLLSALSTACFAAFLVIIAGIIIMDAGVKINPVYGDIAAVVLLVLLAAAPVLGIAALIQIHRSPEKISGATKVKLVIIVSSIFLFFSGMFPPMERSIELANRVKCGTQLSGIGKALSAYAQENDGILPPENWCDLLIISEDVDPDMFVCPASDAVYGESSFALNTAAAGKKLSELPRGMVILFETNEGKSPTPRDYPVAERAFNSRKTSHHQETNNVYKLRWNQLGGPETLTLDNHNSEGCHVLYADGTVRFVEPEKLLSLKWDLAGREKIPLRLLQRGQDRIPLHIRWTLIALVGVLVLIGAVWMLYKYHIAHCWSIAVTLALASCGFGFVFGAFAQAVYEERGFADLGMTAGAILGLIFGLVYAAFLTNTPQQLKQSSRFKDYAVATGMLAGVICSTILHVLLMIMNESPRLNGITAGLPFGILAGAILGSISYKVVKKYYTASPVALVPCPPPDCGKKNV